MRYSFTDIQTPICNFQSSLSLANLQLVKTAQDLLSQIHVADASCDIVRGLHFVGVDEVG